MAWFHYAGRGVAREVLCGVSGGFVRVLVHVVVVLLPLGNECGEHGDGEFVLFGGHGFGFDVFHAVSAKGLPLWVVWVVVEGNHVRVGVTGRFVMVIGVVCWGGASVAQGRSSVLSREARVSGLVAGCAGRRTGGNGGLGRAPPARNPRTVQGRVRSA